jgi:hypothetical protein
MPAHFNPVFKHEEGGCKFLPRLQNDCQKQNQQDQAEKDGRFFTKLITANIVKV